MADTATTTLAAYTTVHSDDLLLVVDVHDTSMAPTGTDKKCPLSKVLIIPTAIKTSAYNAVAGDLVPVDTTGGSVTVTLPTAPADGVRVDVKHIIQGGTNTVTVACGGSDVFNKAGGATSATLSLVNQAIVLQYCASPAIWYVIADDLPLSGLDVRYTLSVGGTLTQHHAAVATATVAAGATTLTATTNDKWNVTLVNGTPTAITISGMVGGQTVSVAVIQDGTGSCTATWALSSGTLKWTGGSDPTLSTGAGKVDIIVFECRVTGTVYAGPALVNC